MTEAGRITAIIDGDISALTSKLAQAKSQAVSSVSGIESEMRGKVGAGISGALSGGDYSKAGKQIGENLVGGITAGFGPLGGAVGEVATALGPTGIVAAAAIAGGAAVVKASVDTAASFQQSMANVASVTGGGPEAFNALSKAAREAGATSVFSASQAADAEYYLASAGYATKDITAALTPTMNMAAAGQMDLARAAELTTTGLAVFSKHASDAGEYTNLLASSAAYSNTNISQIGEAMGIVGGTANTLGKSMQETAGTLDVMANGGLKGAEAGHKLNAIFGVLTKASSADATKAQANAMEEMGISADQINPALHSTSEIFSLLRDKGMDASQALSIFGLENNSAASYLAKNADQIDQMQNKISGTSKASEMASQQNATYQGSMKMLGSAVEEAQISLGSAFLPALTSATQGVTALVSAGTKIGGSMFSVLSTAMAPVTAGISAIISGVGTLGGMYLDGLVSGFEAVASGVEIGSTFVGSFVDELGKVVTGSSAFQSLSSAAQGFYTTLSGIGTGVSDIVGKISSGLTESIPTAISGAGSAVGSLLDQAGLGGVSEAAGGVTDFLGSVYDNAAEKLGWGVQEGTQAGMEAGSEAAKGKIKTNVADATKSAFTVAMEALDTSYSDLTKKGVSKDIASARVYGGAVSDEAALAMINTAGHTIKANQILSSTSMRFPGLDEYIQNVWLDFHGTGSNRRSDTMTAFFESAGNQISETFKGFTEEERDAAYKAFVEGVQPGILDSAKYFEAHAVDFKDAVSSIWTDGAISGTEKLQAGALAKSLEALKIKYPVDFEEADLQGTLENLQTLADGNPIELSVDTGELETNFGIWLSERMDMYQDIYDITSKHGAPVMSYESEQRAFWDKLMASSDPDRMNTLIGYIEKAASASSTFQDVEVLPAIIEEIAAKEPGLLQETATRNMLIAAQEKYGDQVRYSGDTFTVLDANGKVLAETHLRTSQYANIANGGLTKLAEKSVPAAEAVNDLALAAKSAASALNGIHYSGYSPSTSYSSLGSTGYGLGTTYYSGANLTAASTTSLADYYTNASDFNGLLMKGIPKLAKGGMVTKEGLVWAGEGGQELVIPLTSLQGLWDEGVATAASGSIGWYLNDRWFQDLAPTVSSAASYQWSKFPNVPSVMEFNTDAIQRAWLSEDQKSTKDVYSGLVRQKQLDSIGNSLVIPGYAKGETEQPDWWTEAATALSSKYASEWSKAKGGNVSDMVSASVASSDVATTAQNDAVTIKDVWNSIYGESFTEGCIATNAPDPSLVYTPSAKAISDYAYQQAQSDAAAWSYLYGESFTEGCIATVKPDSSLKYTASESIKAEAARAMGGAYWSTPVTSAVDSSKDVQVTLERIALNTEATEKEVSLLKTTMGSSIFSSGSVLTNGNILNTLSGGTTTFATSKGDELVVGKSKEGYVVTYDPRTDTCEGLSFNPPDPSLKTTDRFYLGITAGKLPAESYENGYGWGGRVGWTDDVALQQEQAAALSALQEQQQQSTESATKTTSGIQTIATTEENLLSVAQQIQAQGGTPVIITLGSTGGSSGTGALVVGGGGESSWFSASSSRYGSTFGNDWISGGAAGVGTGSDPAWFTAALAAALGSGYIGSVAGNRSSTIRNTGQYTANLVENTGGSYGGWVPAFANEAFVSAPTLAVVGDRPGGEYVVGAARFESAVAKMGSSPNITIHSPITIQGNGNSDELAEVLARRNRELMDEITELIANAAKGR